MKKIKKIIHDFFDVKIIIISIFAFSLWLKLLYVNSILFDDPDTLIFITFTFMTVAILYSWLLLLNKRVLLLGSIYSVILLCILWFDIVYFRYFESLIKIDVLSFAGNVTGVTGSVFAFISILDIPFFVDIIIVWAFLKKYKKKEYKIRSLRFRLIIFSLSLLISISSLSYILYREYIDGYLNSFLRTNFDINLVELRYGAFGAHGIDIYRYFFLDEAEATEEEKQEIVEWINNNVVGNNKKNEYTGIAKNKNIFMVQLESFESFAIGKEIDGKEITPNINKLIKESYYFPNGVSVIGGGRTSDSDFASNTSIYPLYDAAVFVTRVKSNFTSLPKVLKDNSYNVNAFHAYRRDFWNRGVAFNSLGYDHFYASDEYREEERVIMGLNDESFYRQTVDKLDSINDPQFNYLISLSSHHPFVMAEDFQKLDVEMKDGYEYLAYHYLQSLNYADYSLGILINELKEKGLYEDSLFFIYGDHPAKFGDVESDNVINTFGGIVNDNIPFIIKLPNQKDNKVIKDTVSQVDIMPTILNLVGAKTNFPMFGNDILSNENEVISIKEKKDYSESLIKYNLFDYFY